MLRVVGYQIAMGVPVVIVVAAARIDLHESHSALDQSPRRQAAVSKIAGLVAIEAVQVTSRLRLLTHIDSLRHCACILYASS